MRVNRTSSVPSLFSVCLWIRFSTSVWYSPVTHFFKGHYSLLLQYEILEKLVTCIEGSKNCPFYLFFNWLQNSFTLLESFRVHLSLFFGATILYRDKYNSNTVTFDRQNLMGKFNLKKYQKLFWCGGGWLAQKK